jgi:pyrimidine operon attenuation protein/uracil phosphoribosyltransferase
MLPTATAATRLASRGGRPLAIFLYVQLIDHGHRTVPSLVAEVLNRT